MEMAKVIQRYPLIIRALLAVSGDTDTSWAASVVESAKSHKSAFAQGLVREACRKRHAVSRNRALQGVVGDADGSGGGENGLLPPNNSDKDVA